MRRLIVLAVALFFAAGCPAPQRYDSIWEEAMKDFREKSARLQADGSQPGRGDGGPAAVQPGN